MGELLSFALIGLGSGALIAGLSLGVVLNYRGCGAVNVGLGAVAMMGAWVFWDLRTYGDLFLPPIGPLRSIDLGGPWPAVPAALLALALCGGSGALFDLLVFRRLRNAPPLSKLVTTAGLLLCAQAVIVLRFGSTAQSAPAVLPSASHDVISVAGFPVATNRFMLAGIVILVTIPLIAIYRWTRFGLATRAAAENERTALLQGYSPNRLSMVNTTAAFILAGGFGILVAPITQLDSSTIALAIVPALAAALVANFTSFGIAAAAGLCMGIVESIVTYLQSLSWFPLSAGAPVEGISDVVFLVVIIVALMWRGKSLPERGSLVAERMPRAPSPARLARPALLMAVVCAVLLVFAVGARQSVITSLIAFVACLPLVTLVGYVGQLSVAQLAFAGMAGILTSDLATAWGLAFPLGPLLAIAGATAAGTLLAIPALRVRGVNLAIVTIAAAVAIANFGFANPSWGAGLNGDPVGQPQLFGFRIGTNAFFPIGKGQIPSPVFGFLCLAVALILGLLVANLRRSHLGRWMLAVRGNERAAAAGGVNVRNVKLAAFAFSAMLAGCAGVLYAYNFGSVSADNYSLVTGLTFLAFIYITGIGSVSGAVLAAVMATDGLAQEVLNPLLHLSDEWQALLGGLGLIIIVAKNPDGIVNTPGSKAPPPFNWIFAGVRWLYGKPRSGRDVSEPATAAGSLATVSELTTR